MSYFLWQVTMAVVSFRLACVWFGLGPWVRGFCAFFGGGRTIAAHKLLFEGAAGRMVWNETHLWQFISSFQGLLAHLLALTPESLVQSAAFMAKIWFLLWVLFAVAIFGFTYHIAKQRQAFWKRWKEDGMRDIALNFEISQEEATRPKRRLSIFSGFA